MSNSLTQGLVLFICPLISILAVCLLAHILFFLVSVDDQSMCPALNDGDRVLASRYWPARWLRKGQIVVLRFKPTQWYPVHHSDDTKLFIKRVVGLPGDIVVVTNPWELPEPERRANHPAHDDQGQSIWHIPPRHCFVRGDSPGFDSTIAGLVPFCAIRGIFLMKLTRKTLPRQRQAVSTDPPPRVEASEKS